MNKSNNNNRMPAADTGNASNPSPHTMNTDAVNDERLFNEKSEKYLRESANIEDEPDAQDQLDADETIRKESNQKEDK